MKNSFHCIGPKEILVIVFLLAFIVNVASKNYTTPITSVSESTKIASPSPSEEPVPVQVVENPNGSKFYSVEIRSNLKLSTSISGQFFDSRKYAIYTLTEKIREIVFDFQKEIQDECFEFIFLFIVLAGVPAALLAPMYKKRFSDHSIVARYLKKEKFYWLKNRPKKICVLK